MRRQPLEEWLTHKNGLISSARRGGHWRSARPYLYYVNDDIRERKLSPYVPPSSPRLVFLFLASVCSLTLVLVFT